MSLVVNTNVSSLSAQRALAYADQLQGEAMERLSTGSKINSASDDAAGLAIAQRMTAQVNGLNMAIKNVNGKIDYINSHGTSTPIGDIKELEAIKKVFGKNIPKISSTKSLTGHSLGATGVHEAIYCLLMLNNNFLCGSANITNLDESAQNHNILLETEENHKIENVLSNSFGFGGTNATLLMSRYNA